MNEQEQDPFEGTDEGRAAHGYRNEVTWDGGKGRQPYANRGEDEQEASGAAGEYEGGNAGAHAARNVQQYDAVKGTPGGPRRG